MKVLVILGLTMLSLLGQGQFDRESYLMLYLEQNQLLVKDGEAQLVYLLQVGSCGSDSEQTVGFIKNNSPEHLQPIVLLTNNNDQAEVLVQALRPLPAHKGDVEMISKYGLALSANYVFLIKEKKVVWWSELTGKGMKRIKREVRKGARFK